MNPQCEVAGAIRFGPFEFDPAAGELRKHGHKIKLQGQPIEILGMLLERPGQVISREEIQKKLWAADTNVEFEHSMNVAVKRLRDALDDSPDAPRYIETLPKRGYRFIVPLNLRDDTSASDDRRFSRRTMGIAFTVLAVVGGLGSYVGWRAHHGQQQAQYIKLLALPFVNLTGDPGQEFFADALTDEMISMLGSLDPDRLGVIARTTAMQYKGTKKTVREIARELPVEYVLESSVQRSGERVRITAQLIRARDESHLWSESYERDTRDILNLRQQVAQDIADAVQLKLNPQERTRLTAAHKVNPKAYELYLTGVYFLEKQLSVEMYEKGRVVFEQAIAADPAFAAPYAELANVYVDEALMFGRPYADAYPQAISAAARAIELDSSLAEAHASFGSVKFLLEWDWPGAEREYRRAMALHLGHPTDLRRYRRFLMLTGRWEEGLAQHRRMIELDPLPTDQRIALGWTLKYARRYSEAIRYLEDMLAREPNLPAMARYHLAWNYAMAGRYPEAVAQCEKINDEQSCAYAYAAWGHREKALAIAKKHEFGDPVFTAATYVALGDRDKAFALLERAYREHWPALAYIWAASELDPIKSDPRFQDLLRRMNFPPTPSDMMKSQ